MKISAAKKISMAAAALGAFMTTGCAVMSFSGCAGRKETVCYEAFYGTTFYLPYAQGTYTVWDRDGNKVGLYGGNGFFVDGTGDYSVILNENGKKTESVVKVIARDDVVIRLGYTKTYAEVNKKVKLPSVYAADRAGKSVGYIAELTDVDGEKIPVANGEFIPTRTGAYLYTVTGAYKGKTKIERSVIEAVAPDSEKLRLVAELGSEFGVEHQAVNPIGGRLSYTTEKSHGADSGSMKFSMTQDYLTDQQFCLRNVFIKDLTDAEGIYFWVYNDSDYPMQVSVNYGDWDHILPRTWNKVVFKSKEGWNNQAGTLFEENFEISDINGMTIANFNDTWSCGATFDLYFSSVYALYPIDMEDFGEKVAALPETFTEENIERFLVLKETYDDLSDSERESVRPLWTKASASYGRYLAARDGVPSGSKKVVGFDKDTASLQVSMPEGNGFSFDESMAYGEEQGSTLVNYSLWGSQLRIDYPYKVDCTGFSELYFYVYLDTPSKKDFYAEVYGQTAVTQKLSAGEWVKVGFPLDKTVYGAENITETAFSLFCGNWEEMPENTTFRISAVYVS